MAYPLQISVYYVARVEVTKAVRYVPQLRELTLKLSTAAVAVKIYSPGRRDPLPGSFLHIR